MSQQNAQAPAQHAQPSVGSIAAHRSRTVAGSVSDLEPDIDADPKVAGSRASEGDDDPSDGPYVGRSSSDDDFDAGESGAEARSDD